jgi:hypothetical protein
VGKGQCSQNSNTSKTEYQVLQWIQYQIGTRQGEAEDARHGSYLQARDSKNIQEQQELVSDVRLVMRQYYEIQG